jgi:histidinol-phosphate aminotransferase
MNNLKIKPNLEDYCRDSYIKEDNNESKLFRGEIIDCELGTSPFGQSESVKKAVANFDFNRSVHYFDPFHSEIKQTILEKFSGAGLEPKNIFFGHGSFNLAERVIHKLINPTGMLGYGPQFNEIPTEMVAAGGRYTPVPMKSDFKVPFSDMINAIESEPDKYSIVYIDNPNNPTGQLSRLEDIRNIATVAQKYGIITMIDEAYGDFVPDSNSAFNLVKKFKNIITLRSLSKGVGLGSFRFGYMAISDNLTKTYSKIDVPFEPCLISGVAGHAALKDNEFIENVRTRSRENKSILSNYLTSIGYTILPTHPNTTIMVVHKPEENVFSEFKEKGISVESGLEYQRTFEKFDNSFIRLRTPFGLKNKSVEETREILIKRFEVCEND